MRIIIRRVFIERPSRDSRVPETAMCRRGDQAQFLPVSEQDHADQVPINLTLVSNDGSNLPNRGSNSNRVGRYIGNRLGNRSCRERP